MKLTRRDALAALAAAGAGAGAATLARETDRRDDHERATLVAVARVVYPSRVEGVDEFVRAYLRGRDDGGHRDGVADAVRTLDEAAEAWHGAPAVDLEVETRERLLRELGADTAEPDPEGSPAERVRYHLVNELLFALYASPTGGELVGIENPQGHPGGLASYRRGTRR